MDSIVHLWSTRITAAMLTLKCCCTELCVLQIIKLPKGRELDRIFFFIFFQHLSTCCLWSGEMKRSGVYGAVLFVVIAVWTALKFRQSSMSSSFAWLVDVSPWYLLMVMGCFCLGKLGFDLISFNDYPQEIKKLEEVCLSVFVVFCTKQLD